MTIRDCLSTNILSLITSYVAIVYLHSPMLYEPIRLCNPFGAVFANAFLPHIIAYVICLTAVY